MITNSNNNNKLSWLLNGKLKIWKTQDYDNLNIYDNIYNKKIYHVLTYKVKFINRSRRCIPFFYCIRVKLFWKRSVLHLNGIFLVFNPNGHYWSLRARCILRSGYDLDRTTYIMTLFAMYINMFLYPKRLEVTFSRNFASKGQKPEDRDLEMNAAECSDGTFKRHCGWGKKLMMMCLWPLIKAFQSAFFLGVIL